jgi:hypothetical protein
MDAQHLNYSSPNIEDRRNPGLLGALLGLSPAREFILQPPQQDLSPLALLLGLNDIGGVPDGFRQGKGDRFR